MLHRHYWCCYPLEGKQGKRLLSCNTRVKRRGYVLGGSGERNDLGRGLWNVGFRGRVERRL